MNNISKPYSKVAEKPPASAVGWLDWFWALPFILGVFFYFGSAPTEIVSDPLLLVYLIVAALIPLSVIELRRAPWRSELPSRDSLVNILERASLKLIGLFASLAAVAFLYWLFPEYERNYYDNFFEIIRIILLWIPIVAIPYFIYVEWRLPREDDGYLQAARLVMGKWSTIDWDTLTKHSLSWLVKGFFVPIMIGDVVNNLDFLRTANWNFLEVTFAQGFSVLFSSFVYLELVYVAAGYIFTLRLLDTHIRAVDRTLYGWVIALIAYTPFLHLIWGRYLAYNTDGIGWMDLFSSNPTLLVVWGSAIIVLVVLHFWSDACFGLRFSNLTNRGIITNGLYRYMKHPAYVIKNIRWWMVAVPFVSVSPVEAFRLSTMLLGVNLVYTLRSYTEEKLLSQDPVYVEYAKWMDERGMLRFLGKWLPFMSYQWRLSRWQRKGLISEKSL
jgi:isoprenylcysteine carboxyl methyltransferase (ICMT) family protein YpbQ